MRCDQKQMDNLKIFFCVHACRNDFSEGEVADFSKSNQKDFLGGPKLMKF